MVLIIALIQGVPVLLAGAVFRSKSAVQIAAAIMIVLALAMGRWVFFAIDLVAIGAAYLAAINWFIPQPVRPKAMRPAAVHTTRGDDDRRSILRDGIETTAEVIERDEGRSRQDAVFLAIVTLLDDLKVKPNGQDGARLTVDLVRTEYPDHFNDVLMYLGWRDGMLHLKPEVEAKLIERLSNKSESGT